MPTIDPFPFNVENLGSPYTHAHAADLAAAWDSAVDLPFVSSAVFIAGGGALVGTLASGEALDLRTDGMGGSVILPVRMIAIGPYNALLPEDWRPTQIVALW